MDLISLRERIDAVDRQIIALLAERLRIVEEVALAKLDAASPFRDRQRPADSPVPDAALPRAPVCGGLRGANGVMNEKY